MTTMADIYRFVDSLPRTYDEAQVREAAKEWMRQRGTVDRAAQAIAEGHVIDAWRIQRRMTAGGGA